MLFQLFTFCKPNLNSQEIYEELYSLGKATKLKVHTKYDLKLTTFLVNSFAFEWIWCMAYGWCRSQFNVVMFLQQRQKTAVTAFAVPPIVM